MIDSKTFHPQWLSWCYLSWRLWSLGLLTAVEDRRQHPALARHVLWFRATWICIRWL